MATTLKRILAVVALIAVVFTVGFLVFTGNRLSRYPNARENFENKTYLSDDGSGGIPSLSMPCSRACSSMGS